MSLLVLFARHPGAIVPPPPPPPPPSTPRPTRTIPVAITLTLDRVDYPPGGGISVQFNGGNLNKEFANLADLQGQIGDAMDVERLALIMLAHWLTKSLDASDDSLIEGATFEYDPAQNLAIIQKS
jgi:hypothetical protein